MKFWTSEDDVKAIGEERDKKFAGGTDHDMFLHIGFFISCYAIIELRLSLLLAKATGINKLRGFDLLTRGMDVRVKIERLRRACEKALPIGPNLNSRLNIMDSTMRPLRNKVAHSNMVPSPDGKTINFASLATMPEFIPNRHPDHGIPDTIEMIELFECCAWLRCFNQDLASAFRSIAQLQMIEIENPQSPLPPGSNQSPGQPKTAAKPGKRDRKRLRKGQPPRGKPVTPE